MTLDAEATVDQPTTLRGGISEPESSPTPAADVTTEPTDPTSDTRSDADPDTALITDEQANALKDDPVKLRKELQRAFTQKTQQLAKERKDMEPFRELIAAYQEDAVGTIEALARQAGLEITKPQATTAAERDPLEVVKSALTEALGPEYEDLSERLAPALMKAVQLEAARVTKPLQDAQAQQLQTAMVREADNELKTFGDSHPDWKQYEGEMNRLATLVEPKRGAQVDPQEFLDILYTRAKGKKDVADATKKVITKMQRSTDGSSADSGTVGADKIALAPNTPPTFKQAAEFARRGQRLE